MKENAFKQDLELIWESNMQREDSISNKVAAAIQASSELLKGKAEFQETQLAIKEKNIRWALVSLQKLQEKFPNCKWTHNQMEKAKVQVE